MLTDASQRTADLLEVHDTIVEVLREIVMLAEVAAYETVCDMEGVALVQQG